MVVENQMDDVFHVTVSMLFYTCKLRVSQKLKIWKPMPTVSSMSLPGISAIAAYIPPFKVRLEDWCQWTGNNWEKVSKVTGNSFRMLGPHENVYTMAANAVLRLIKQNGINPAEIGFLGLGTESSTDNSAGAVIIRGMVDQALQQLKLPGLSRHLEVPEFKHACLGGVYGLKAALRYVAYDGQGKKAIVVSADIAEYERGSSGEQTQGAGAVAMLIESVPQLLAVDLQHAGSASAYRSTDFRKPVGRYDHDLYAARTQRRHDFPVFNGRYSTYAYLDEVAHAVEHMVSRLCIPAYTFYRQSSSLCFHRPFQQMPMKMLAFLYVRAMMCEPQTNTELAALCHAAGISPESLLAERVLPAELAAATSLNYEQDPFPSTNKVADALRAQPVYQRWLQQKMGRGSHLMQELGNLYSASLPANLAAMLEDACGDGEEFTDGWLTAIGYGSGDAAEALPLFLCEQWRLAAGNIRLKQAMEKAVVLDRVAYENLHDSGRLIGVNYQPAQEFIISHVGQHYDRQFQDLGIEYYAYVN